MITADYFLQIVRYLESSSIEVCLDGGWGVDALVGEQTRPHNDLDIVVSETAVPHLRSVIERAGFREIEGGIRWYFVLADERGREVDVHTVRFDEEGNGLYGPNGLMYPAGSLDELGRCAESESDVRRQRLKWRTVPDTNGVLATTTTSVCSTSA